MEKIEDGVVFVRLKQYIKSTKEIGQNGYDLTVLQWLAHMSYDWLGSIPSHDLETIAKDLETLFEEME